MCDVARINNTLGKFEHYLGNHNCVCVSVSGGADSDIIVHIIATHFRKFLDKIHFVFANTGIEYRATLQHIKYLEEKYDVSIEEVRGMPIPIAVKRYGVPFISKQASEYLQRLQKHGFHFEDGKFEDLYKKYPKCKVGIRYWTNDWGEGSRYNINWNRGLKEFLVERKPDQKFSAQCCYVSKKSPLMKYQKAIGADLYITGERKSEGGARAGRHANCFEHSNHADADHFMPLWFWDDDTKKWYCEREKIKHSDCYDVYGLKRTGCVGCPFGRDVFEELETMKKYEPQCYKLCESVFGESYELTKQYRQFKDSAKAS